MFLLDVLAALISPCRALSIIALREYVLSRGERREGGEGDEEMGQAKETVSQVDLIDSDRKKTTCTL